MNADERNKVIAEGLDLYRSKLQEALKIIVELEDRFGIGLSESNPKLLYILLNHPGNIEDCLIDLGHVQGELI